MTSSAINKMDKADAIQLGIDSQPIPSHEVAAHSLSFSDYNGRLFCWKSGIYRAIPAEQAPLYQELFDRGAVRSLTQKNLLVPTALTNLALTSSKITPPSNMVLRHHRIPFISYPSEWCNAMFKAATLLHLDLCIELDRYNCTTDDAHPINILFEGCHPYFVDFGSINRLPSDRWYPWPWPPYEQFCQTFLYPLLLKAYGQGRLARWSLHDFENGVLKSDIDALIARPFSRLRLAEAGARLVHQSGQPLAKMPKTIPPFLRRPIQKSYGATGRLLSRLSGIKSSRREFLQQVREEVAGIALPTKTRSYLDNDSSQRPKNYKLIRQILSELKPHSVLDINSGERQGSYALLAAKQGCQVVAIDAQETRLNGLYQQAKAQNFSILPLWINFASPSYGLSNDFLTPAHQRLTCDLVMALSIDDELLLKRGFNFVVNRLAAFSSRWLLIEFVPRENPVLTTRWQERVIDCPWYRLDNFVATLKTTFSQVDVQESCPSERKLLVCRR